MAHKVVHLDEIERIPGPETLTWLPVRATLDIRAFGCNAYVAGAAGEDVVEPHTEEGADHQELYFVARGRAQFTVDGDSFDAPAGTYVFIPEPESHRHAVAAEAGTTVLSFGGPPKLRTVVPASAATACRCDSGSGMKTYVPAGASKRSPSTVNSARPRATK